MEAPKRIFASYDERSGAYWQGVWSNTDRFDEVEYIRADLAPKWISVEDELPESWSGFASKLVLVHGGVARYDHRQERWITVTEEAYPGRPIEWEVTHWMPLPQSPND